MRLEPSKIDKLVHEKVMGFSLLCPGIVMEHRFPYPEGHHVWQCSACLTEWGGEKPATFEHEASIPFYTINMAAAWYVFRHIVFLDRAVDGNSEKIERFAHALGNNSTLLVAAFEQIAEWTPQKICLAALKACGIKIEQEEQ